MYTKVITILATLLLVITSILSYREWQRYMVGSSIETRVSNIEKSLGEMERDQRAIAQELSSLSHVKNICLKNMTNVAFLGGRVRETQATMSTLIDKISQILPGGSYIVPPEEDNSTLPLPKRPPRQIEE